MNATQFPRFHIHFYCGLKQLTQPSSLQYLREGEMETACRAFVGVHTVARIFRKKNFSQIEPNYINVAYISHIDLRVQVNCKKTAMHLSR